MLAAGLGHVGLPPPRPPTARPRTNPNAGDQARLPGRAEAGHEHDLSVARGWPSSTAMGLAVLRN